MDENLIQGGNITPPLDETEQEGHSSIADLPAMMGEGASGNRDLPEMVVGDYSIPSDVLNKFWAILSTDHIISNLTEREIHLFLLQFELWQIAFEMSIPHRHSNDPITFIGEDAEGNKIKRTFDKAELFEELQLLFEARLRRSKEGFTLDKLTSFKQISKIDQEEKKKKGWFFR